MGITQTILRLRCFYAKRLNITPQLINNGRCEDFAGDIEKAGFGYAIWGGDVPIELWSELVYGIKDWFSDFADSHCFTMFNNKFYDSECPQGCNYPDDLPFFQRQYKEYF